MVKWQIWLFPKLIAYLNLEVDVVAEDDKS